MSDEAVRIVYGADGSAHYVPGSWPIDLILCAKHAEGLTVGRRINGLDFAVEEIFRGLQTRTAAQEMTMRLLPKTLPCCLLGDEFMAAVITKWRFYDGGCWNDVGLDAHGNRIKRG
jgi:hypothetical protein